MADVKQAWMVSLALGVRAERVVVRADSPERAFERAVEYLKKTRGVYGEPVYAKALAEGSVMAGSAV